jgi:hypothetical protein
MLMIEFASLLSICGFRDDFNIIQRSEYRRQALSGDRVIVGDDNPDLLIKRAIDWRARLDIIITACVCHRTTSLSAATAEVLKLIVLTTFFGFVKVVFLNDANRVDLCDYRVN